ncbi:MAG: plastocyanin/azurin family copper-binding protein [Salinigranum sp.]
MIDSNVTMRTAAGTIVALTLLVAGGAVAPVAAAGAAANAGSAGSAAAAGHGGSPPVAQMTNNTTTGNATTGNATNATAGNATNATGENATLGKNMSSSPYTPVSSIRGQLNNSTMRNMSKSQLIARIQSLQRVMNQTQKQYLARLRHLELLLNRSQAGNASTGNVRVTGNFPENSTSNQSAGNATAGNATAGNATNVTEIKLGGQISGWQGMSPQSINGTTNPTLNLQPGQTYRITWVNLDGAPHNIAILNSNGDVLLKTQIMSQKGEMQSVTFTANESMTTYICQVHPSSMVGNVSVQSGNSMGNSSGSTTMGNASVGA